MAVMAYPPALRTPEPHPLRAVLAMRRQTIRSLAAEVGCNAGTLGRCVNGYIEPWPALRHKVAEALGASEAELWHDHDRTAE